MKKTDKRVTAFKILTLTAILFCVFGTARAASFTVNQAGDAGDGICDATCTLRDAVISANNVSTTDAVSFAANVGSVTLTNEIVIANNGGLFITGPGANLLTIDGGAGTNRIFFINQDAVVSISGVTLTGGNGDGANQSGNGGAIFADRCSLSLDRVHVTGNTAAGLGGGVNFFGGTSAAAHSIFNSTFSNNAVGNNQSAGSGGAFYAVFSGIDVFDSTFSGNSATGAGGAAYITGAGVTARSDTITANSAGNCGGIDVASGATFNFGNSIIAGNAGSGAPELCAGSTTTSAGYNLVGDSAGDSTSTVNAVAYQSTDLRDLPPRLGPLQNNGGTTPTHALSTSGQLSPAIDKGSSPAGLAENPNRFNRFKNSFAPTADNLFGAGSDQRGFARPIDFASIPNAPGGDGTDIGAYEAQSAPTAASVTIGGRLSTTSGRGINNALIRLIETDGTLKTVLSGAFGYYRFTDIPAGQTVTLEVFSKRFGFANSVRVINVAGDVNDADFIAAP